MTSKHRHHIIPKHMGGSNDPENIAELTVEEHIQAHLRLYEEHGKYQDLCAANLLKASLEPNFREASCAQARLAAKMKAQELGLPSTWYLRSEENQKKVTEKHRESSRKVGEKLGKKNRENGHMRAISLAQTKEERIENGKRGGATTMSRGKGAFANREERLKVASLGGKTQGDRNAESGHLSKISKDYWDSVRNGDIARVKRKYYFSMEEKRSILLSEDDPIPEGYVPGRKIKFE